MKVGTGIGAGIFSNGLLHRGADGAAGDIGHIAVEGGSTVLCRCGRYGCLEAYAGGAALARQAQEAVMSGQSKYLADLVKMVGRSLTAEHITRGAIAGDPECLRHSTRRHGGWGRPCQAAWKASEAISRDTMKPMPAMAPAPVTAAQPTGGRIAPRLTRVSSQAAPTVPAGFPAT